MRALLALLFALPALAGCLSDGADDVAVEPAGPASVLERAGLPFDATDDMMSHTLEEGVYGILDPIGAFVEIELPATEGGAAIDPANPPRVHLGVVLPDIPGCDFEDIQLDITTPGMTTSSHGGDCRVPVIADAGPYWGESDVPADERGSGRLGETLIQNFVPHGYAVAQISVFGSGQSNHCFDMFGLAEQLGVAGAVEWLGGQAWSNGNVGLIGRSYDGSTPWMAAAHAGPDSALKTIVPVSGLSGLQDLVTWNGASEGRILTFHNVIYGTFGVPGPDPASAVTHRATCPDWLTATPLGGAAYLSGDEVAEGTYWDERSFVERTLENYEGSVYLVHGLLDDNVDPHAGWVAHQAMIDAGLETKGLYGQWYHSYPDRYAEHGERGPTNSVRFDWTQDLLEWFDHYLKEEGPAPDLHIEVQQHDGRWRLDDGLMPSNAEVLEVPMQGLPGTLGAGEEGFTVDLGVLDADEETLLGGLSHVELFLVPSGPNGQVYVELFDATTDEGFGLAYGITTLEHAPARPEGTGPAPGLYTVPLQYFAGALPAGHELGMRIASTGNDFLPQPDMSPMTVQVQGSTLYLSTIPGDEAVFFDVPERTG